jgi:spore cortex formation protein SpoVR/YcgB (stage V sporulation)
MDEIDGNLAMALELACQCQRVEHIVRGRRLVGEYIVQLGVETVEKHAHTCLDLEDEWEYRRLGEIFVEHSPPALERHIAGGLRSANPEVREAATDFEEAEPPSPADG